MSDRKVFQDSVTPLPTHEGLAPNGLMINAAAPEHGDEMMTVLFSLEIPAQARAQLEERVAKGEVVPLAEQLKSSTPSAADRDALIAWLKEQGFEITRVSADGTSVYARASVAQIEKSLGVNMVRVTKDGVTYTAAQNAPSLPADVGAPVHAIIGLQPFRQMNKHSRNLPPSGGNRQGLVQTRVPAGVAAIAPSPNIANAPPYLVSEVLKAYNADGLQVTGNGQTIAILIDRFPDDQDLQAFWQQNGLPDDLTRIDKINVGGITMPAPEGEETLDAEWASGIAPGARIRIYAAASLNFPDLDDALDRIIEDLPDQPGMRQLSISLGLGEQFMGGPQGEVAVQSQKFLRLAAAGVNVFVSTGDAGSNPDETGHSPTGPTQAEYPSTDPSVIAVGGTTLHLAPDGAVDNETGWTSGGGGKSIFFDRPSFQTGNGITIPDPGAGSDPRLVPDVSLAADPNTGAFLILQGRVRQFGGTSWSAPVWAGFCALINEARTNAGKDALGFLNPLIYPLIGSASFRDILIGSNGAFTAGPGHDLVTGIGVPAISALITALTS